MRRPIFRGAKRVLSYPMAMALRVCVRERDGWYPADTLPASTVRALLKRELLREGNGGVVVEVTDHGRQISAEAFAHCGRCGRLVSAGGAWFRDGDQAVHDSCATNPRRESRRDPESPTSAGSDPK